MVFYQLHILQHTFGNLETSWLFSRDYNVKLQGLEVCSLQKTDKQLLLCTYILILIFSIKFADVFFLYVKIIKVLCKACEKKLMLSVAMSLRYLYFVRHFYTNTNSEKRLSINWKWKRMLYLKLLQCLHWIQNILVKGNKHQYI